MYQITTICKNCKKTIQRDITQPIERLSFCCSSCWEEHFKSRGYGLVHPDCPDLVKYEWEVKGAGEIIKRINKLRKEQKI